MTFVVFGFWVLQPQQMALNLTQVFLQRTILSLNVDFPMISLLHQIESSLKKKIKIKKKAYGTSEPADVIV